MSFKVAILGSGNISTDLLIKIQQRSVLLDLVAMVGVDPHSDGLARARSFDVPVTHEGLEGFLRMPEFERTQLVFDTTSAVSHRRNAEMCNRAGIPVLDLTRSVGGPYVVPAVNLEEHLLAPDLNLISCAGQATVPIVHAVSRVAKLYSAEIVATIAAASAGTAITANLDRILTATREALRSVGGAQHAKATLLLDETDPPVPMQDYVICVSEEADEERIRASVEEMIATVQAYASGYQLTREIQFERIRPDHPVSIPGLGSKTGLITQVFLEVKGAGHYLPTFAGNLDIMTSAAVAIAERIAANSLEEAAA